MKKFVPFVGALALLGATFVAWAGDASPAPATPTTTSASPGSETVPATTSASPTATPGSSGPSKSAPDKVVAYRQTLMGGMGKHMKALGMITKGEIDRPQDALAHATALHDAAMGLGDLFPQGSGPGDKKLKTDAKAEIWSKHDDFAKAVADYESATSKLVDAAKTGDMAQIKDAYGKVGEACGGCHDPFRVKD